ncbi:hypothetical protein [Vibrio mediterranei]|uniref:hypothetical protein n=1 Tax=Vibrio mediterranei TaxID=689 RepID=UPI00148B5B08|nr:hypothetical protein [Vibrio mediterranei]
MKNWMSVNLPGSMLWTRITYYEIRQTAFIPSIGEINQWLEVFDHPSLPSTVSTVSDA